MKQLTILLLLALLAFSKEGKSQEQYSLNDLLKQAIENSHQVKKATLQQSESALKTKEVIAKGFLRSMLFQNGHP